MKFSIIVPVYNIENYLETCLKSIIEQTYKNYEVIIINDGSTDNSQKIIDKYVKKDNRFIGIKQSNKGVGEARNTGIKKMTGDYLVFVDGDDYVDCQLLETLNNKLKINAVDLLRYECNVVDEKHKLISKIDYPNYENQSMSNIVAELVTRNYVETLWSYCFKISFWKKNKFNFSNVIVHEDFGLMIYILSLCQSISSINYHGYYYVQRQGSLTKTQDYQKVKKHVKSMEQEDNDGDLRILNLEVLAKAKIQAIRSHSIEMVSDFFCPAYQTELVCGDMEFEAVAARVSAQNALRDVMALDSRQPQIAGVYNVIAKAVIVKAVPQNGKILVEGKIEAYILYLTDSAQSPIYSVKKEIPFSYALEAPAARAGMQCRARGELEHINYTLNVANEVELRCILVIRAEAAEKKSVQLITDCSIEPMTRNKGIVIYFIQNGDTLWDIAKQYCVAIEDILDYNHLSAEDRLTVGEKLIIPAVC